MQLTHPSQYWHDYKQIAYDTPGEMPPAQELELRKAFHAGIEAVFIFMATLDPEDGTRQLAEDLRWFRRHNKATAMGINREGRSSSNS